MNLQGNEVKEMRDGWVKRNPWIFVAGPLALALFVWAFGELAMHLWNWLAPTLFGWRQINFWQALGLLLLCRMLFGGFGSHGRDRSDRRCGKASRWEKMTPEEREKFRQDMRARWSSVGAPDSESKEPA
jgi:hypothetical protein